MKERDFAVIRAISATHCIPAHGKGFDIGVELTEFFSGRNEQKVLYCFIGWAVKNGSRRAPEVECEGACSYKGYAYE